jgi:hypothetical protein
MICIYQERKNVITVQDNELLHWHNRYDITISKAKIELASGGGIELRWNGADKKDDLSIVTRI